MKLPDKELIRKAQFPLIIACATVPLVWILMDFRGKEMLPMSWIYPSAYVAAVLGSLFVPGKRRMLYGIATSILCAAVWISVMPPRWIIVNVIIGVFYCILLMWSMKIAGLSDSEELSGVWFCVGFVAHLLGQIILHMDRVSEEPQLRTMEPWFLLTFYLFALLVMLSANRRSIVTASGKRRGVPKEMRGKNVVLTVGLFMIGLVIAMLPSAFRAVKSVWVLIVEAIKRLVELLPSRTVSQQEVPMEMATGGMPMMAEGEAGKFAIIMEKIALVAGAIITTALVGYLLYRLYKIGRRLIIKLWAALGRYAASVSEDYEDEITDTRDSGASEQFSIRSRKRHLRAQNEKVMNPAERVRYRYLRVFLKHPEWSLGSTARENIPQELASVYERARYSDHPITEAEAVKFSDGVKRI